MRALPLVLATLLLAAPAAPAAASSPGGAVPAAPSAVRVLECTPALEPAARSVTFEARMRPVRRSVTMALRFSLQSRSRDGGRWRRVAAEGFDAWLPSEPSVRRYVYAKTVRSLLVPASYRAVVRFRWYDEEGAVVARARAVSPPCAQPDLRPDLVPRRLEALPAAAGLRRYAVVVRNAGAGAAGASTLQLDVGGAASVSAPVPALAPGEARSVAVTGPACVAGLGVTATVDAGDAVDEADEAANVLAAPCPP
jgi:hypothetical protein